MVSSPFQSLKLNTWHMSYLPSLLRPVVRKVLPWGGRVTTDDNTSHTHSVHHANNWWSSVELRALQINKPSLDSSFFIYLTAFALPNSLKHNIAGERGQTTLSMWRRTTFHVLTHPEVFVVCPPYVSGHFNITVSDVICPNFKIYDSTGF